MKYRKKPVIIDAIQVTKVCSLNWDKFGLLPDWIREAHGKGILSIGDTHVSINTLEGTMKGEYTDMIIKGVSGELYPCKLDIFEATYDKVEQQPVDRWGLTPDDMKRYTANTGLRD